MSKQVNLESTVGLHHVLNRKGYYWRAVPKVRGLSAEELAKRKVFIDKHADKSAEWWQAEMNLVLDGVTLTNAPRPLTQRQRHMAQRITHMWMEKGDNANIPFDSKHFYIYLCWPCAREGHMGRGS